MQNCHIRTRRAGLNEPREGLARQIPEPGAKPEGKEGLHMLTIIPVAAIWIACTLTLAIAGIIAATAED